MTKMEYSGASRNPLPPASNPWWCSSRNNATLPYVLGEGMPNSSSSSFLKQELKYSKPEPNGRLDVGADDSKARLSTELSKSAASHPSADGRCGEELQQAAASSIFPTVGLYIAPQHTQLGIVSPSMVTVSFSDTHTDSQ
ncbi:hypothetical protein Tsubulata_050823, partial [Turnera subulata]